MADVGIDLPIESLRSELLLVDTGEPLRGLPALSDLVSLQYVRIEGSGDLLVGNSDHSTPRYADPDAYSHQPEQGIEGRNKDFAPLRLPDAAVAHTYAGCYDITPRLESRHRPRRDRRTVPRCRVQWSRIQDQPAVGDLMADLIVDGDSRDPDVPAADFFSNGSPRGNCCPAFTRTWAGEMR